jgi:predicted acylesterase/phospholipase RssA
MVLMLQQWACSEHDSMDIIADHICGCIAYPFYGLKWIKIDDRYLWDGALINSTPLRSVIQKSYIKKSFMKKR